MIADIFRHSFYVLGGISVLCVCLFMLTKEAHPARKGILRAGIILAGLAYISFFGWVIAVSFSPEKRYQEYVNAIEKNQNMLREFLEEHPEFKEGKE